MASVVLISVRPKGVMFVGPVSPVAKNRLSFPSYAYFTEHVNVNVYRYTKMC